MAGAPLRLTEQTLAGGIAYLAARDPDLAAVVARHGPPPLWARDPGFPTLVQIILEQQVSLASGRAAFERLADLAGGLAPARIAELDDAAMRGAGVSRQKASYIRELARMITDEQFDPDSLEALDDDAARAALLRLRGIGDWSADIYLLMALRRADVWPTGDLALLVAAREVKRLRALPDAERMNRLAAPWRPWRGVAARLLWHHYLSTPRRRAVPSVAKRPPSGRAVPSRRPAR